MYCTETYIMITITLYECDLCYLVQDFYNLSKLLGGGGGGGAQAPLAPPPSVRHWSHHLGFE